MTCEVLENARNLAKKRGLDIHHVRCPADMRSICTPVCALVTTRLPVVTENYPKVPSGMERFDSKLLAWAEKRGKM